MKLTHRSGRFFLLGDADAAQKMGFSPEKLPSGKWTWSTKSHAVAYNAIDCADDAAAAELWDIGEEIAASQARWAPAEIPAPEGMSYYPFQIPAILYAARHKRCLIADDMGLGKTIEAIGLANLLGLKRLLIICPAHLRDNWVREYQQWFMGEKALTVIRSARQVLNPALSVIVSYELIELYLDAILSIHFDMLIVDEAHRVKNKSAKRTKLVLGHNEKPGLVDHVERVVLLTGSPIPNWPDEIYWPVHKLRPEVIDHMTGGQFIGRFCTFENSDFGVDITGAKNEQELYNRLRSGFMVRRKKEEVLPDLPELQFKLIVYPAYGAAARVIEKEKEFNAQEIYTHGVPFGSPFPEVRHEMSHAKVGITVDYVKSLFEDGTGKVLVFGHHVEPMKKLACELAEFNPAFVIGATKHKQLEVDRFQTDPACRVFIGNDAAFEGYNLTAGAEVVFHESSFVPEENAQALARAFRLGQSCKVTAHIIVIEASIEAYILGRSAKKLAGIKQITDGELL